MKHAQKKYPIVIFMLFVLLILFSSCKQTQTPQQPPNDEQTTVDPWENLPVVGEDGTGVVNEEGGVIKSQNGVKVEVPRGVVPSGEEIEVSLEQTPYDPVAIWGNEASSLSDEDWYWYKNMWKVKFTSNSYNNIIAYKIFIPNEWFVNNKTSNESINEYLTDIITGLGNYEIIDYEYDDNNNINIYISTTINKTNAIKATSNSI